jgi:phage virion morphogenesis (putative tail completion) protein
MAQDLAEFERWMVRVMQGLEPARRRAAALKLAQALRRANLARIAANIESDGSAMPPRKASMGQRGRLRRKAGAKMFRRLRLTRSWKIGADADGLELMPASPAIDRIAAVHHFGELARVGRLGNGRVIRTRYTERRLLGFSADDNAQALEVAASLLGFGGEAG